MSLLHIDSFEGYDPNNVESTLGRTYSLSGTAVPIGDMINTTNPKTGSQCLKTTYQAYATKWFAEPLQNARLYMGFGFRWSGSTGTQSILNFSSLLGAQTQMFLDPAGTLSFKRYYNVLLATSSTVFLADTWYYIEIKMTISNSTSFGDVVLRVNGVTDIELGSGIDTSYNEVALQGLTFGSYVSQSIFWDDLYICDDQGTVNNTFLGECVVECLRPNGNGATSQWTGSDGNSVDNYLLVDDQPLDDVDYIESDDVGYIDLFEHQNLSIGALVVHGIRVVCAAGREAPGERFAKNMCRSSGVNYEGDEYSVPTDGWLYRDEIWETDPATGVLWSEGAIGTLQTGIKISS